MLLPSRCRYDIRTSSAEGHCQVQRTLQTAMQIHQKIMKTLCCYNYGHHFPLNISVRKQSIDFQGLSQEALYVLIICHQNLRLLQYNAIALFWVTFVTLLVQGGCYKIRRHSQMLQAYSTHSCCFPYIPIISVMTYAFSTQAHDEPFFKTLSSTDTWVSCLFNS